MIEIMSKEYVKHLDRNGSIIIDLFMEDILDLIEKHGMLPPAEYHEQDRDAKVTCNRAEMWMKWETEDEE